jgi:hypothetical protein
VANPEIVEVFSTANPSEAHLVKNLLERAGIEVAIVDEHMGVAIGGWNAVPRVWVAQADWERARKVIEGWEAKCQIGEPGLSLCPWTCLHCGEEVPGGFDVCWHCNHAQPTAST